VTWGADATGAGLATATAALDALSQTVATGKHKR